MPETSVTPTPAPPRPRWPWIVALSLAVIALWRLESGGASRHRADDHSGLAGAGGRGDSGGLTFANGVWKPRGGTRSTGPTRVPGVQELASRRFQA